MPLRDRIASFSTYEWQSPSWNLSSFTLQESRSKMVINSLTSNHLNFTIKSSLVLFINPNELFLNENFFFGEKLGSVVVEGVPVAEDENRRGKVTKRSVEEQWPFMIAILNLFLIKINFSLLKNKFYNGQG